MKKVIKFLVPLLLGITILASIVWYLFIYDRAFTRDTLLGQARFHDLHGNSRMSAWFYDMAYSFSGHDENVAIELANQYKADGNYTKAEYTLTNAISSRPTAELYAALCRTFVEQDKLLDAVYLMDNISDSNIKAVLDAQRPTAPKADRDAGYYSQYMDIHLSSSAPALYYTVDGSYPSVKGLKYSDAITLPTGETTVYAISVDENGLVSPVTVLGYTITGIIEPAVFTDADMEAAIRAQLGIAAEETVYTNQLWEITEFTVPEGIANIADVALMPYLKSLTVHNRTLDSLSCLSTLTLLEKLDLTGCSFPGDDLAVLANLPGLSHLTLSGCGLSTIADLSAAQALTHLDLSNNSIRPLDALSPMTTLVEINLENNAVVDLTPLGSLPHLQKLNISHNFVTTLAPIIGCSSLTWLEANTNQLDAISGIHKLKSLQHLSLEHNKLTDVALLSEIPSLVNLSIAQNSISDISMLDTLVNLEVFDFSSNQVTALPKWPEGCPLKTIDGSYNALTSIKILKRMDQLTHVYMDYNLLTNIDPLAECFCLVQVNVFGNQIEDVSKLRERDIIVNYDPTVKSN